MCTFTIRPFDTSHADYEAMTAIDTAFYPYPLGLETFKHIDDSRPADLFYHRDMIECAGQIVAFGEYGHVWYAYHPDKYRFYLVVHPNHEHPDIRPMYLAHVMRVLADRHPLALFGSTIEGKPVDRSFLHENGFVEIMRTQLSELKVQGFDPAPFAHVAEKVRTDGIEIITLIELQARDPDWKHNLYDLEQALIQDVPSTGEQKQTFEDYVKQFLECPTMLPDGWFVALDGEQLVGTSRAFRNPAKTDQLDGSLTGVIRSHRRRGIATALKLRLIRFAQEYGAAIMLTSNEENNPIYTLNRALGFTPQPAWIDYEKVLCEIECQGVEKAV